MIDTFKLLIIESTEHDHDALKGLLMEAGHEVQTAISIPEASELVSKTFFDLILVDLDLVENHPMPFQRFSQACSGALIMLITDKENSDISKENYFPFVFGFIHKDTGKTLLVQSIRQAIDHKRLLEHNRHIESQLKNTEILFSEMVHHSPDPIFMVDQNQCFTFVNQTFTRLFGYPADCILGKSFCDYIPEPDRNRIYWFFNDRRNQAEGEPSLGVEVWIRCAPDSSGKIKQIPLEMRKSASPLAPFFSSRKDEKQLCIVGRDVRCRIRFERQLIQAQKMEAIGTMAGALAHDFNNLLMNLLSHVSVMLLTVKPDTPLFKKLNAMEQQIQKGSSLTRQLLQFARGENGFERRLTDMNELIKESLTLFHHPQKMIRTHLELAENLWPVDVDPTQIQQVLLNLFINAQHAMPEGGDLTITSKNISMNRKRAEDIEKKSGNYVRITVSDTGMGIEKDMQKKIFDPFFTTREKGEGTGLGLASVYGIMKGHQGTVEVSSEPGNGTTFFLDFLSSFQGPEP